MSKHTVNVQIEVDQKFIPSQEGRSKVEVHTIVGGETVSTVRIYESGSGQAEYFVSAVLRSDHYAVERALKGDLRFRSVEFDSEMGEFVAYVSGWTAATALAEEVGLTDVRLRAAVLS
jgi:hypothetical protein